MCIRDRYKSTIDKEYTMRTKKVILRLLTVPKLNNHNGLIFLKNCFLKRKSYIIKISWIIFYVAEYKKLLISLKNLLINIGLKI